MIINILFCITVKTEKLLQDPPESTLISFYSKDILENWYVYIDLEAAMLYFIAYFD